jgi:hypothetical protein
VTAWYRGEARRGAERGEREPERWHEERQRHWVEQLGLEDTRSALWAALLTNPFDLSDQLDD